jgi:hypothetical protein
VAGKINNGCQFVAASSQGLFVGSNASLQVTSDFTFSFWARIDTAANGPVIAKTDASSAKDYEIDYNTGIGFFIVAYDNAAGSNGASVGAPATTGTWYHVVAWFDSSDRKTRIRINDGSTVVSSDPALGATLNASATAFTIGQNAAASASFITATVDEVGFWKRLLNAEEITALYNAGAALAYGSFTT